MDYAGSKVELIKEAKGSPWSG